MDGTDRAVIEEKVKFMFEEDMKDSIKWKRRWKKIGNACLAISKGSLGFALICDFVAGFYDNREFSFASGCANALGLALMSYGAYAFSESAKRAKGINVLVKRLDLKIPEIVIDIPIERETYIS